MNLLTLGSPSFGLHIKVVEWKTAEKFYLEMRESESPEMVAIGLVQMVVMPVEMVWSVAVGGVRHGDPPLQQAWRSMMTLGEQVV